jgi:hypothetical protein
VKELLDSCPPECRGLEWYCLKGMWRGPKGVNGAPHPDKADLRALASPLVRPARRPAGANESDPAGPLRVLPGSFEVVILDSTREGGRTVTCDSLGTVKVRGADGWELSLPGVHVRDPNPPPGGVSWPGQGSPWLQSLRRCVKVVEGESLSWYPSYFGRLESPDYVTVLDLTPGDD